MRRILAVAAVVAVLAVGALAVSRPGPPTVAGPGPVEGPTTATSSTRARPPTTPTITPPTIPSTVPRTLLGLAFAAQLDRVLANTFSCLVVADGVDGATVYEHQGGVPLAPASTQKLMVAAAALDDLGPGYRFTTTVVARRRPVLGQVDDLWLVGAGDPLLATPEYAAFLQSVPRTAGFPTTPVTSLADQLAAAGVKSVGNGVHGDDSRYEPVRYLSVWPPQVNRGEFDVGPLSALEVDQGLDSWRPARLTVDPTGHGAGVLARLLSSRGVTATQGPDGPAPARTVVLARVQSAPLVDIVAAMLRASDNQIAELAVREIDRQNGGNGTTAGGLARVNADLMRLGVPTAGVALVDGSGLAPTNRSTCRALLAALDLGDQPRFAVLRSGLAVAGQTGTLARRFLGTAVAGHLAAKTGTIIGAGAMVGRLDVSGSVRFALVANGPFPVAAGVGLEDRVVGVLSGYRRP